MARRGGPVRWLHRLGLNRPQPDEAVALEIEHHVAELSDRLVSEGWQPVLARQEAERRFGDARRYGPRMKRIERRRLATEQWVAMCNATRASLRSVARTARRYPGFTAAVVVTLGLGIGANVTMYGILDRLLLRPPAHIVEPDHVRRLMVVRPILFTGEIRPQSAFAYPDYEDLKAHSGMSVAAYEYGETTVVDGERTSRARTGLASAELFPLLGVQPLRGRFFTTEESGTGHPISAVLSEEYWRSAFGSHPDILSRTILVDGHRAPILGVAPPASPAWTCGRSTCGSRSRRLGPATGRTPVYEVEAATGWARSPAFGAASRSRPRRPKRPGST